jgi:hypothetical protein
MPRNQRGSGMRGREGGGMSFGGILDLLRAQPISTVGKSRFSSGVNNPASRPGTDVTRGFEQGMGGAPIAAPAPADRQYMQEVVNLSQQADPYMQNAGMYAPNVEQAYGKPMPERDYADEKEGLLGKLNAMEEANLQSMGYGNAPDLAQAAGIQHNQSAAVDITTDAEKLEAANNLQPMSTTSYNYGGFKGPLNVQQTFGEGFSLDSQDAILGMLEQSRNKPDPRFRRQ